MIIRIELPMYVYFPGWDAFPLQVVPQDFVTHCTLGVKKDNVNIRVLGSRTQHTGF